MNKPSDYIRNPEEIKAEISHYKNEIAKSISSAADSFHPDEMIDAGLDYVADKTEQAYTSTKAFVRENPVSVALATIGVASLIFAGLQMKARNQRSSRALNNSTLNKLEQKGAELARKGSESLSNMQDSLSNMQDSLKSSAKQAQSTIANKSNEYSKSIKSFAQERPILTACIGAAVGAVIGSALPRTRFEDETLGPVRDGSLNHIQQSAEQLVADAKHAVAQSLEGESSRMNEYETADYQPKKQRSL